MGPDNLTRTRGASRAPRPLRCICDNLPQVTSPARINAAIHAALKPGAKVAIVDFTPPGEETAPADRAKDGMHGVLPETIEREMKDAGFEAVSSDRGQRWFVVALSKPQRRVDAQD